ncbi:MAG: hypothetical protein RDO_0200 [Flavobacteriales endosymbiont of Rhyzopertha dominica]|nr:MAG: 50S ribosomal protein L18 [Candidatus Shikimatogenerans bostrichidophilus]
MKNKNKIKKYGTKDNPRLSIFKSNKEIYVQIIDDINNNTIISYSSIVEKKKNIKNNKITKSDMAYIIGKKIALKILSKKIKKIFFVNKRKYKFHGIIKIIIETIRKNGIKI